MKQIALFGSGKIGAAIAALMSSCGKYKVKICDINFDSAQKLAKQNKNCEAIKLDLDNEKETDAILSDCEAVISALPFYCNVAIASSAARTNTHYLDLTEDVKTTKEVTKLAQNASVIFIPQCGIAPGFISIAAAYLVNLFDSIRSVKMRVGALPLYPSNHLKYNLSWSTEGLINEYCNMCEIIDNGKRQLAYPLEGYETFSLDGDSYECFNTSGGLGSLCDTLDGKVETLNYRTIRYPGHRDLIAFLLNDLQFKNDRDTLRQVFERGLAATTQDKCIIFTQVRGHVDGKFLQKTYASTVYNTKVNNQHFSAIQLTTACGICAPCDMLLEGQLKNKSGIIKSEDISLPDFLNNEFGSYYKDDRALAAIS